MQISRAATSVSSYNSEIGKPGTSAQPLATMAFVGCLRGLGFVYELLQSVHVVVELLLLLREVEQRRVRPSDLVLLALEDQVVERLRLPGRQLRDELLDD